MNKFRSKQGVHVIFADTTHGSRPGWRHHQPAKKGS
jgi:hypothetical protein